jgi:hypothetical protein
VRNRHRTVHVHNAARRGVAAHRVNGDADHGGSECGVQRVVGSEC